MERAPGDLDSAPTLPGERPLCEGHFLQLCERLDRLEKLLLAQPPPSQLHLPQAPRSEEVQQTWPEGGAPAAFHVNGRSNSKLQSATEVVAQAAVSAPGRGASKEGADSGQGREEDGRGGKRSYTSLAKSDSHHQRSGSSIGKSENHHQRSHSNIGKSNGHHRFVQNLFADAGGEPVSSMDSLRRLGICQRAFWQSRARRVLHFHGRWVDMAVGLVILVNAVCIGVDIQFSLEGKTAPVLNFLEHVFLVIFLADLVLRLLANEKGYLWSGWFFLDAGLVSIGVLSEWILRPQLVARGGAALEALRQILILRILRLLRLVRALRLLEMFEQLWKLSNGLVHSAKTVIYALVLVLLTTYIFACFAVEVITTSESLQENPDTKKIVDTRFHSLFRAGLTLLSFTNADSLASVYEPLIEQNPLLALFFAMVWLVVTVSLMNLVTAVIVDNAIAQSRADTETKISETRRRVKKLLPEIQKLFDTLDQSRDGSLEIDELDLSDVRMPDELRAIVDEDRLKDLFQYLDEDGSGSVDKDEFTDGVMNLALQNVPIETTQTLQLLRSQQAAVSRMQRTLEDLAEGGGDPAHLRSRWCDQGGLARVSVN